MLNNNNKLKVVNATNGLNKKIMLNRTKKIDWSAPLTKMEKFLILWSLFVFFGTITLILKFVN